jgi:hypothetical protein
METILIKIRKYKYSYKDFVNWLQSENKVNNVSAYLALQDKLSIGVIIEYLHNKQVNILLGNHTACLILGKGYTPFKSYFEHKGMKYLWCHTNKDKVPFSKGMNIAIDAFFNELNEQLEILNK